jgi:hypothetical protein
LNAVESSDKYRNRLVVSRRVFATIIGREKERVRASDVRKEIRISPFFGEDHLADRVSHSKVGASKRIPYVGSHISAQTRKRRFEFTLAGEQY